MSSRVAPPTPPAGGVPFATVESFKLPSRPPATAAPVVVCLYKATGCATDLYGRFQDLPLWQVQVVHEASDGPNVFRNMFEASVAVTAGTNRGGGEGGRGRQACRSLLEGVGSGFDTFLEDVRSEEERHGRMKAVLVTTDQCDPCGLQCERACCCAFAFGVAAREACVPFPSSTH